MQSIIGQSKLLSIIDSYTLQTLPKTLMFIGQKGCGKHTFTKYVVNKFNFDFVEITESITATDLDEFLFRTIPTCYLIDLNKFSEKQQNQFLKFIEEPSKSVYIILIANSEAGVLNTVLNRCTKYHFEPYTKDQVEQIIGKSINELTFTIFQTPGKLLNLTEKEVNNMLITATELVCKINCTPYTAILAISTKINYKDLYDKIDFNLFFDTVEYIAIEKFKHSGDRHNLIVFNITNKFKQYATQQNLIKETLMLNYLTTLWEAVNYDFSRT